MLHQVFAELDVGLAALRQKHAEHMLGAERPGAQRRDDRAIFPARDADDGFVGGRRIEILRDPAQAII